MCAVRGMCMQSPIGLSLISLHYYQKKHIRCHRHSVPVKPLYNTSIKIILSPLSMLYLQEVLLIRLKNVYSI